MLEATGISFDWEVQQAGEATIAAEGTPLPDRVIESIRRNRVAIKGPITTPVGGGFRSVERRASQRAGALRQRPAGAQHGGRRDAATTTST